MLATLAAGWLGERAPGLSLVRRALRIVGRTESHTEEAVRPLYPAWAEAPVPIAVTILASLGQIELHLSARARSRPEAEAALDVASSQVIERLGMDVYSRDGRSMEHVVGDLLVERNWRIAVAESCTGGLITSRLTDVPGSSRYVERGVVAYTNESKVALLGVALALIEEHGAVSEPVAIAMAEGIRMRAATNVGIGVTGIAGPGGGTPQKPVGTVAVAAAAADLARSRVFRFIGDREHVKFQASQAALDMVRRMLLAS
jgi:nicotinamide-nucleotide amidase